MTLKRLYSELSKIIDENIDKNPDILDANVVFDYMPCSDSVVELMRSGFYPTASVIIEDDLIILSNVF